MTSAPPPVAADDRTEKDARVAHELPVQRFLQPDDVTCGPTCLRKVYSFYGLDASHDDVIASLERNEDGGTLAVFLGIAALVYAFFIKALGILLFAVEIGWFVLLPLARELAVWRSAWPRLRGTPRAWRSAALLLLAAVLPFLPWPGRVAASGLLHPAQQFVVYAPPHAQVSGLPVGEGQRVEAGAVLITLSSPDVASRLAVATTRVNRLRWQASAGSFDDEQRAQWQVSQEQLAAAEADVAAIRADAARYAPTAPFAGVLRDLAPDMQPGTWLSAREPLARLVADQGQTVVAYLDEDDVARIAVGDTARFYSDGAPGPVIRLEVAGIDADASRTLAEAPLAALFGGSVAAREKNGQLHPERPVYRVTLKAAATTAATPQAWRGTVVIAGRWAAPGWRYLRGVIALVRREAGF